MEATLQDKIDRLPTTPGVYLMKDRAGKVIYVGKAVDLRSRVKSYFTRGDGRAFVPLLDDLVGDVEVILVQNDKEARLLENELIKKHKPRFNVMLRDDKDFIVLRLDTRHPYPRLEVRRSREVRATEPETGVRYFGPYSSAQSIRETLRVVNRHFGLRTCTDHVFDTRKRPCILFQIGRCPGPCVYDVPKEEYGESVHETAMFLQGKADDLLAGLKARMKAASEELRFEQAARLRDQIFAVERSLERQSTVTLEPGTEQDVLGLWREGGLLTFYLLQIRGGRVAGGRSFSYRGQEFPDTELVASFIDQYYQRVQPPREVLLPLALEGEDALASWLSERRGEAGSRGDTSQPAHGRVQVLAPERGDKRRLVEMASENAQQSFAAEQKTEQNVLETLERLRSKLGLSKLPRRVECYDISSFQGAVVVGSQITFVDGEPHKAGYRHFKIRGEAKDDFASMYEVLSRRLKQGELPDLIVLDGGKGQLSVAMAAMRDRGISGVDVVALAKSRLELTGQPQDGFGRKSRGAKARFVAAGKGVSPERVFLPRAKDPIVLPPNSSELFLLARVRDEAHRFAITFHQKLRGAQHLRSALEEVAGIGAGRRRALLSHFGSLKRVRAATLDELTLAPGMNATVAERLYKFFHAGENKDLAAQADALAEEDVGLADG